MLPKHGNSNSQKRIDLVNRFIRLFGKEVIKSIVADREFAGEKWLGFLNYNQIKSNTIFVLVIILKYLSHIRTKK